MKDEIQERFNKLMRGLLSISLKLLIPAFPLVAILLISKYPKTIENTFRSLINGFVWLYSNPISIVIVLVFVALMYVFLPPLLKEMKSKISSKTMTKKAGNKKQTNTENNNATTSKTQAEEVLTEEASAEDIQVEEKVVRAVKSRSAEKYEERSLLTPTEKKFYQYLIKDLEGYDVVVNSKVRLEDILKVVNTDSRSELYKMRGYVKSRHIDFILCDSEMNMICGIEVDDDSHSTEQAKEIDEFKNDIFRKIHKELYRIVKMDKLEEGAQIIVDNLVKRKMIKKKKSY